MRQQDRPPRAHVYLLRCWEERGLAPQPATWRFSIEDPYTGRRRGFGTMAALVAALEHEMSAEPDPSGARPSGASRA